MATALFYLLRLLSSGCSGMLEADFFHETREALDEVSCKVLNDLEWHKVILPLIFHGHEIELLACLLHKREESLEFDVVRLADLECLIEGLDCFTWNEIDITVFKLFDLADLVDKATEPGYKLLFLGFIPAHQVPQGKCALCLQLRHNLVLFMTRLLYLV